LPDLAPPIAQRLLLSIAFSVMFFAHANNRAGSRCAHFQREPFESD
jgi:hypothetical protein